MLTAKAEDTDRIVGLEMGADDYLPKDFNPRELLSRVRAVLRRSTNPPAKELSTPSHVLEFHGWRIVLARRQLFSPAGALVPLRSGKYDLLLALVERPQRVLTRDQLLDLAHGRAANVFDRSIDVQISRLRRKIEADPKEPEFIKTVRSGGYVFFWRRDSHGSGALKLVYPDTIAARIGATIIVSLAALVAISFVLVYLEGASNGEAAEWLTQGRITSIRSRFLTPVRKASAPLLPRRSIRRRSAYCCATCRRSQRVMTSAFGPIILTSCCWQPLPSCTGHH